MRMKFFGDMYNRINVQSFTEPRNEGGMGAFGRKRACVLTYPAVPFSGSLDRRRKERTAESSIKPSAEKAKDVVGLVAEQAR